MTTDKALDLALEALEGVAKNCWRDIPSWRLDEIKERITAIKQARSAPVQEPVAMPENWFAGMPEEYRKEAWRVATPPAAQRQWVGLEREIAAAVLDHCYGHGGVSDDMIERTTEVIKTKLKELNT
jgi:hypothetical protein